MGLVPISFWGLQTPKPKPKPFCRGFRCFFSVPKLDGSPGKFFGWSPTSFFHPDSNLSTGGPRFGRERLCPPQGAPGCKFARSSPPNFRLLKKGYVFDFLSWNKTESITIGRLFHRQGLGGILTNVPSIHLTEFGFRAWPGVPRLQFPADQILQPRQSQARATRQGC